MALMCWVCATDEVFGSLLVGLIVDRVLVLFDVNSFGLGCELGGLLEVRLVAVFSVGAVASFTFFLL